MNTTEKVVNDLNAAKLILCNPQMLTPEMYIRIGQAITNALALLKQEAIEPIKDEVGLIHCGNCNAMLEHHPFYCWNCGQKVKWE